MLTNKEVEADFGSGLGRLSFLCGAVIYDRTFLAPLYAHAANVRQKTGRWRLQTRHTILCNLWKTIPGHYTERFRTDAKAEGDTLVLGGYQTRDGLGLEIRQEHAKWFTTDLDRKNAAWGFAKGEPYKTIAS